MIGEDQQKTSRCEVNHETTGLTDIHCTQYLLPLSSRETIMSIIVILSANNQPHWNNNGWHHLIWEYIFSIFKFDNLFISINQCLLRAVPYSPVNGQRGFTILGLRWRTKQGHCSEKSSSSQLAIFTQQIEVFSYQRGQKVNWKSGRHTKTGLLCCYFPGIPSLGTANTEQKSGKNSLFCSFLRANIECNFPALVAVLDSKTDGQGRKQEQQECGQNHHHRNRDSKSTTLLPIIFDVIINDGVKSTSRHWTHRFL